MDNYTNGRVEDLRTEVQRLRREMEQRPILVPHLDGFWAKITAVELVAANRWKYSWTEITWGISAGILTYTIPTNPRIGPISSSGYAWNTTEMDNVSTIAGSGWEDQSISLTSDTINIEAINPIGTAQAGGTKFPIVWMRQVGVSSSTERVFIFTGWNTPMIDTGGY